MTREMLLRELARLERMAWAADATVAATIHPYVLLEAINCILNSTPVLHPIDYTQTGEDTEAMLRTVERGDG